MSFREKVHRNVILLKKRLLFTSHSPFENTLPAFILGSGRSGTTMLLNVFQRDDRVEALGENHPKIAHNYMLVKEKIRPAIENCTTPVLIMKPILNSFDAFSFLKCYNNSKIIWLIRNYRAVVASSIREFGTRVSSYMKNLVLEKKGNNWLSLGIPPETMKILTGLNSADFTQYDWTGLVWWSVNRTISLDQLYHQNNFLLPQYEDLVRYPNAILPSIYDFIGLSYNQRASKYIHTASVNKGVDIKFHPIIKKMCDNLYEDLKNISNK